MPMHDMFLKLNGGEILGLCGIMLGMLALIGGIIIAIVKSVAVYYRKTQLDEMEATLKMEMIQRGMSADEIKQVLEAKMGASRSTSLGDLLSGLPPIRVPNIFNKEAKKS